MARFARLELSDVAGPCSPPRQLAPVDERFLAQAEAHYRRARFELALRCFSRALAANPNRLGPWLGQVRMLLELGEPEEASTWAGKALELFPDSCALLAARAVACARGGEPDRALELSDAALATPGRSSYVWLARGEILLCGRRSLHTHSFAQALALAPADWFTPLLVARLYLAHGQPVRALGHAGRALALAPAEPFAWSTAGEVRLALGCAAAAGHAFARALELEPGFIPAELGRRAVARIDPLTQLWRSLTGTAGAML